jgi:hypothetical protein
MVCSAWGGDEWQQKTPLPSAGAGFWEFSGLFLIYLEHMPSARTSVGNKEYEYKGKEKRAAKPQTYARRLLACVFGDGADVGALRHDTDHKAGLPRVSTVRRETIIPRNRPCTRRTSGRPDVRAAPGNMPAIA